MRQIPIVDSSLRSVSPSLSRAPELLRIHSNTSLPSFPPSFPHYPSRSEHTIPQLYPFLSFPYPVLSQNYEPRKFCTAHRHNNFHADNAGKNTLARCLRMIKNYENSEPPSASTIEGKRVISELSRSTKILNLQGSRIFQTAGRIDNFG